MKQKDRRWGEKTYNLTVVDDDENVIVLWTQIIKHSAIGHKFNPLFYRSGAEAIADNRPCDILLTDYMMPSMDGVGLIDKMKAGNDKLYVCMMSCFADYSATNSDRIFKNQSIDEFVNKPIVLSELFLVSLIVHYNDLFIPIGDRFVT